MLASAPVFYPQLLSFYFFVVIICSGGREFGVVRESFGFPLSVVRGSFGSPQKGIVFQEEEREFLTARW